MMSPEVSSANSSVRELCFPFISIMSLFSSSVVLAVTVSCTKLENFIQGTEAFKTSRFVCGCDAKNTLLSANEGTFRTPWIEKNHVQKFILNQLDLRNLLKVIICQIIKKLCSSERALASSGS